ncbi:hypothetical protein EVAR_31815_1 [Eumeta japonica]|uniref:Uncharacterized protein n=1 Tax=Eumeta variegata TaxID=151549 RepID=A0A4C1W736_EUMVA|nr:hypothetical protein EVAR_31815_1 [Eumeta japonica]
MGSLNSRGETTALSDPLRWKQTFSHPNLQSAIHPIPHTTDVPVPKAAATLAGILSSDKDGVVPNSDDGSSSDFEDDRKPKFFPRAS